MRLDIRMMSLEEKLWLISALKESVKEDRRRMEMSRRDRAAELADIWCRVTGMYVLGDSRRADNVWGRAFIAWEMHLEGYTEKATGEMMGRDHSAVHHLKEKASSALGIPSVYGREIAWWEDFKREVDNELQ